MKIVKVLWYDTASNNAGWKDEEMAKKWGREKTLIQSVGFLIEKNKFNLLISAMIDPSKDEEDQYTDLQKIPVGTIIKIITLK